MENCCARCRYWKSAVRIHKEFIRGECRRFPPVIISGELHSSCQEVDLEDMTNEFKIQGYFPIVDSMEWCGEFNEREETHNG